VAALVSLDDHDNSTRLERDLWTSKIFSPFESWNSVPGAGVAAATPRLVLMVVHAPPIPRVL
jgi:hypothetical protein